MVLNIVVTACRFQDLRYSPYDIHLTIFILRYSVYDIQFTIFALLYSLYDVQFTIFTLRYSVYGIRYNLADLVNYKTYMFKFDTFVYLKLLN